MSKGAAVKLVTPIRLSQVLDGRVPLVDLFDWLMENGLLEESAGQRFTYHLRECEGFKFEMCRQGGQVLYRMLERGDFPTAACAFVVDDVFRVETAGRGFSGERITDHLRIVYEDGEIQNICSL